MRTWRLPLIAAALLATTACHDKGDKTQAPPAKAPAAKATPAAPATELVSLAWKPADANQNLQSFDLRLTGVDLVSVCHKPVGWIVKATSPSAGVVDVKAYATVGAAFISVDQLNDLESLLLVRGRAGEPSGVSGKLLTGVYGGDQSQVAAAPDVLSRTPAEQCPPTKA